MEELIACIARSLVKNPEAVTVTKIQKKGLEVYQLHVAPEAAAVKANKKVSVDIV